MLATRPGGSADASRTRDYVYGNSIDELVHSRDLTGTTPIEHFYHQDDLFSVIAATDDAGAVVERYQYGDYGDRRVFDAAGNSRAYSMIGLRHGFTGQLHDDESGLILMRHRHLNPRDGKWLQRDPAWYVDGAGLAGYVGTSPLSFIDPLGLESYKLSGAGPGLDGTWSSKVVDADHGPEPGDGRPPEGEASGRHYHNEETGKKFYPSDKNPEEGWIYDTKTKSWKKANSRFMKSFGTAMANQADCSKPLREIKDPEDRAAERKRRAALRKGRGIAKAGVIAAILTGVGLSGSDDLANEVRLYIANHRAGNAAGRDLAATAIAEILGDAAGGSDLVQLAVWGSLPY